MNPLYRFFSSIRLTVTLLTLGLLLVFFGTLDQVNIGIRGAQEKYFEHVLALWQFPDDWFFGEYLSWLHLPIPGGYLIGPLLTVNLLVAHFRFFKLSFKKAGIAMIHAGVLLLLVGQLVTNIVQEEDSMWITEGESANYLESFTLDELFILDRSDPRIDKIVSIPTELIEKSSSFEHPALPFRIEIIAYFPNSILLQGEMHSETEIFSVDQGIGVERKIFPREIPRTFKQDERNRPSAIVRLVGNLEPLGTWLTSAALSENLPPQIFKHKDREFEIGLRVKRTYLPYTIKLIDFSHDRYSGTEIPKNFSSLVNILHQETKEERQALIYMNNPLRYEGRTFYQAKFARGDIASMFQVIKNPGWPLPYISCILVSAGLFFQFGTHLLRYVNTRWNSVNSEKRKL